MKRAEAEELFTAEVRALQGMYSRGHAQLVNWANWSRDRSGLFPTLSPPGIWNECVCSKFDDFADESDLENVKIVPQTGPAKAERVEIEPYDEKAANELDIWLHAKFPWPIRRCLNVAYVMSDATLIELYPTLSRCTHDMFLANLSLVLSEVER